jgi:hypothetical protein
MAIAQLDLTDLTSCRIDLPGTIVARLVAASPELQEPSDHESCYFNSNDFTAIDTPVDAVMTRSPDGITIMRRN